MTTTPCHMSNQTALWMCHAIYRERQGEVPLNGDPYVCFLKKKKKFMCLTVFFIVEPEI